MGKKKLIKEDLQAIALYALTYQNYMKAREFEKVLLEHIEKEYVKKNKKSWDHDTIIADTLYGDEGGVEAFMKRLKEQTKKKK